MTGRVLRIEKCSIHDGDGLRTVVFLKGCPLRCLWCSTPESQAAEYAHGYGRDMSAEEVVAEIAKDEMFFFHSGGGVTISGGEPLAQPEFCRKVLSGCRDLGINAAIETSAFCDYAVVETLLPLLDVIYADVKLIDEREHLRLCGVTNEGILGNISRMSREFPGKLRIRTPLVPSVNMNRGQIEALARFCKSLPRLDYAELLPYHRLGIESYRKLGMGYALESVRPPSAGDMERAKEIFGRTAPDVRVV